MSQIENMGRCFREISVQLPCGLKFEMGGSHLLPDLS